MTVFTFSTSDPQKLNYCGCWTDPHTWDEWLAERAVTIHILHWSALTLFNKRFSSLGKTRALNFMKSSSFLVFIPTCISPKTHGKINLLSKYERRTLSVLMWLLWLHTPCTFLTLLSHSLDVVLFWFMWSVTHRYKQTNTNEVRTKTL